MIVRVISFLHPATLRPIPPPLLRRLFLLVCGLALALTCIQPAAAGQSVHFAVFIDPTHDMPFSEVRGQRFTPIGATFGGGFSDSAYWLRVTVDDPDAGTFRLRFRPPTTDRIELFAPQPGGGWSHSQNGERFAPSGSAVDSLNWYAFDIEPRRDRGPWYVRVQTQSPGAVIVTLVPLDRLLFEDVTAAGLNAVNYALLSLAAVVLMGTLAPLRSLSNICFLGMIASFSAYLFTFNGYARSMFGVTAAQAEGSQEFLAALTVFSLAIFHYAFLREFRPAPIASRLCLGLAVFAAFGPIASVMGQGLLSLEIAISTYVALVPLLAVTLFTLQDDAVLGRGQLRLIYGAYLSFLSFNITARLGWIDMQPLYRFSVEAITMATSTLILSLLWLKNRHAQEIAAERALALQSLSVDLEIDRQFSVARLALLRRIDAQVETLSNAVNALAGVVSQPRALRALAGLRRVVDRCLFAHETSANRWNLRFVKFAPSTALRALAENLAPSESFHFDFGDAERVLLTTDRDLFEIAAENVLSNALRYRLPDRPVGIEIRSLAHQGRNGVLFRFTNAAAEAPFDRARVFDKFYRGASSKDRGGTGLGLSITRDVVEALSGFVTLDWSKAPHGADVTLCLWLPVAP